MNDKIEVGNFVYEQDEKFNWTFKAKEPEPIKKEVKYRELPQFDIIYDIDAHMQGQMDNEVKLAIKEILEELK